MDFKDSSGSITMKELPVTERPYERCARYGPTILSDAELLAVILRSGAQGQTALALSQKLLSGGPDRRPLSALTRCTLAELTAHPGVGKVKAIQIQCIGELSRRIAQESACDQISMNSPETIANYFMEDMRHLEQEEMRAALFDTKTHLLREVTITRGTVNASLVTPREVYLTALRHQAVFLVLVHNHPSGDPTPSREDLLLTKRMKEAGDLLEIPLLDHIIIGDRCFVSLKEQGLM